MREQSHHHLLFYNSIYLYKREQLHHLLFYNSRYQIMIIKKHLLFQYSKYYYKSKSVVPYHYHLCYSTVLDVYNNTMKTTFLFKFCWLTSFFQITIFQVNKEKLIIDSFSLFPCLCVTLLFESLHWWTSKIEIKSRLYCIDIYDDDIIQEINSRQNSHKTICHHTIVDINTRENCPFLTLKISIKQI